jgi:hypothetical protein
MVEGSKARSKGGRVRKRTTLNGCGLKGVLGRKQGLKGAFKRMVEGSKARSKGGRVRKRTTLNGCGIKGTLGRKRGLKGALERK